MNCRNSATLAKERGLALAGHHVETNEKRPIASTPRRAIRITPPYRSAKPQFHSAFISRHDSKNLIARRFFDIKNGASPTG
jgi:hypothetical protein